MLTVQLFYLLCYVTFVKGGCRWYNPEWLPSLNSAPTVQVSETRIVTISWSRSQFVENMDCSDRFDVGVVADKLERRVCSVSWSEETDDYNCKLDLSDKKHCAKTFGFWVTAVNGKHYRGLQRVRSFADTQITVRCDGPSQTEQVKSSSCFAVTPTWETSPFIEQSQENQLRMSWDLRQLENSQCVKSFQLKFWQSGTFNPKSTNLKFEVADEQNQFGGKMEVQPCSSYTYILAALSQTGESVDTEGTLKIPCPGQPFLEPVGQIFSPPSVTVDKVKAINNEVESVQKSIANEIETVQQSVAYEVESVRQNNSRAINSFNSEKKEVGKTDSVTFPSEVGEVPALKDDNTNLNTGLSNELEEEFDFITGSSKRIKPPSLTSLNSSTESLTWQLEGLDPKIRIDKYQVACWENGTAGEESSQPCCKVEEIPLFEGDETSTLTVPDLKPNTPYSCQGGMLVQGKWMFSPKALKFTESSSIQHSTSVLLPSLISILLILK